MLFGLIGRVDNAAPALVGQHSASGGRSISLGLQLTRRHHELSECRERKLNLTDMRPARSRRDVSLVFDETCLKNRIAAKELGHEWHSILPCAGTTRRYEC